MNYIIVGDSETYKEILVYTCGTNKEKAEKILNDMLTNPSKEDKVVMKGLSNFKIDEVEDKDCWWKG